MTVQVLHLITYEILFSLGNTAYFITTVKPCSHYAYFYDGKTQPAGCTTILKIHLM